MEVSKETLNNVGILTSNIIELCTEEARTDDDTLDWSGLDGLEAIYKEASLILTQLKITEIDCTNGIVEA